MDRVMFVLEVRTNGEKKELDVEVHEVQEEILNPLVVVAPGDNLDKTSLLPQPEITKSKANISIFH